MGLHAIESGSGAPLLLIHGLFDSLETWEKLIPRLSGGFKAYAVDLPAFGKSLLPRQWKEGLSGILDELFAFLDARKISKISLLGSSMGGGLSLAFAEQFPERIERIALLNPYALPVVPMAVHAARRPLLGHLLPYLLRRSAIRKCAQGILSRSIHDPALLKEPLIERVVSPFSTLRRRKDLFRFLRSISPERIVEIDRGLPNIRHPVLILWGEEDGWLSEAHWKHLKARLPDSKVLQIPQCGHLPQVEKADLVATSLLRFFAGLPLQDISLG